MNEKGINKIPLTPQVGGAGSRLDMSGVKAAFSNSKKILHKSGSNIIPNIVTDYILQELKNFEKIGRAHV